jgi:hypothetical protein
MAVLSEFRLFCRSEKPRNSGSNHFSKEKNPWNSVPNLFWMRKTSEFYSEPFLEEKKPQNSVPFCFFPSYGMTVPRHSESNGISTLFCGITKTVPSLFRGIFSERNFDGNPRGEQEQGDTGRENLQTNAVNYSLKRTTERYMWSSCNSKIDQLLWGPSQSGLR